MIKRIAVNFRWMAAAASLLILLQNPSPLFSQAPQPVYPAPGDNGQADTGQPVPVLSPNQLDNLVAPIALYPDPLISQILVASTYPLEVVEANQWMQRNPGLTGPALTQAAQAQNWDPSVQALVMFPDVIKMLNEDVSWTTNLGNAFLSQQADVLSSVQRMRVSAQQNGKLSSTPQETVSTTTDNGQQVVVITPTNPEVIYVPEYDPYWVWGPAVYYPYPRWYYPRHNGFFFGVGISIGGFLGGGWGGWGGWGWHPGWGNRTVIVNNTFIHRYNFNSTHVAGFNGTSVWSHNAFHRQGVPYPSRALNEQFRGNVRENLRSRDSFQGAPAQSQVRGFNQSRQSAAAPLSVPRAEARPAFRDTPRETMGNRSVAPNLRNRNQSAFGGIENGATARYHADHGYSSLGPARSAPAPRSAPTPRSGGSPARSSQGGGRQRGR